VTVRAWLTRVFGAGDDEAESAPDALVEVANVPFQISQIVVAVLADAGVEALAWEERANPYAGTSRARIVCRADRAEEAKRVLADAELA
jgi:hypothetical protein